LCTTSPRPQEANLEYFNGIIGFGTGTNLIHLLFPRLYFSHAGENDTQTIPTGLYIYYMPSFPKAFGRRKSGGKNFLEEHAAESPGVEPSFKVFERADGGSKSFDGGVKFSKANGSGRPRTSHMQEEENMFANVGNSR
jgi:hypothetical protein